MSEKGRVFDLSINSAAAQENPRKATGDVVNQEARRKDEEAVMVHQQDIRGLDLHQVPGAQDYVQNSNDKRIVQFRDNKNVKMCDSVVNDINQGFDENLLENSNKLYDVNTTNSYHLYDDVVYSQAFYRKPSPLKWFRLQSYLSGYDSQKLCEIVDIVKNGAKIHSEILFDPLRPHPPNQKSTQLYHDLVEKSIFQDLLSHKIAGPFLTPPPGLIVSPLGAVPKRDSDKIRIIHNLSFPEGDSVNSNIPRRFCTVQYQLIDHCTQIIASLGPNCLISKGDWSSAFTQIPVCLEDLHLLGFSWNDLYYFHVMVPMGSSVSCNIFEKFSTAFQWILENKFNVQHCSHILDDFMFFGLPSNSDCLHGIQSFLMLSESLGMPVKQEKTVWPSTSAELHGILFDTKKMSMSLPPDKMQKAKNLIDDMFKKQKVLVKDVQQIHGFLNFACRAVAPGRTFLRRIANLLIGQTSNSHHIRLSKEAKNDLVAWKYFLQKFSSTPILPKIDWKVDVNWRLYSDASGKGFSSIFGSMWIMGKFPVSWWPKSIAIKELTPIYLGFCMWIKLLQNSKICFLVDNESIVHVLRSKTSRDPIIMSMIRRMVVLSMLHNIQFYALHVPGRHNVVADLCSRFQVDKARKWAQWLDKDPTPIPKKLLPWSKCLLE